MRVALLALAMIAVCGHPWRNAAIVNGVVAGAATTCEFECGQGIARPVSDVVLVVEAVVLAATAPLTVAATAIMTGEESKH